MPVRKFALPRNFLEVTPMKNEILEELWKIKNEIGKEFHYDVSELVKSLRNKAKRTKTPTIDFSTEPRHQIPQKKKAA